jgi:hypothetical protein
MVMSLSLCALLSVLDRLLHTTRVVHILTGFVHDTNILWISCIALVTWGVPLCPPGRFITKGLCTFSCRFRFLTFSLFRRGTCSKACRVAVAGPFGRQMLVIEKKSQERFLFFFLSVSPPGLISARAVILRSYTIPPHVKSHSQFLQKNSGTIFVTPERIKLPSVSFEALFTFLDEYPHV